MIGVVWIGRHGGIRDVMPDCVLNLVRGLYPNTPGQPWDIGGFKTLNNLSSKI